jgi:hypothetical protein
MLSDCSDLGGSSRSILPTLIKVTFRPQSLYCCSFIVVIRDGCGIVTQQGSESASSDNNSGLSDDDECSSKVEQKRLSTSKHSRWLDLDEQRLLAYKKEGKS